MTCLVALALSGVAATNQASASPGDINAATVSLFTPAAVESDIDTFWRQLFASNALAYSTPAVYPLSEPVNSGCGYVTPDQYLAFYCSADFAVYWSVPGYDAAYATAGEAAWVNVMAHEWSHHVQLLLGLHTPWRQANDNVGLELEATCMGGAYVGSARDRGLVDEVMIDSMVGMFIGSAAHGSTAQVQAAFLGGLDAGIAACGMDVVLVSA
jgi:predicted metalloprotease